MKKLLFIVLSISLTLYAESGFYSKKNIKPYFSFAGAFWGNMALADLNDMLFDWETYHIHYTRNDSVFSIGNEVNIVAYEPFKEEISFTQPPLTIECGVQYYKFLLGIKANYTFTQTSSAPATYGNPTSPLTRELWDVKFYTYSMGLNTGWMLLDEKSFFNIIPQTSFGFTSVNATFPGAYTMYWEDAEEERFKPFSIEEKYYTSFGKYLSLDLDLRFNVKQFAFSAFGGYKVVRYDHFTIASSGTERFIRGTPDSDMDSYYVGAKVTFTMLSTHESEQLSE